MKSCRLGILFIGISLFAVTAAYAVESDHPVIFAHGMAGFDDILGYDYWGNDYGAFVGSGYTNGGLSIWQQSYAAQVTPFASSEVRGYQLANEIETYMASVGATYVNIIGHSQGGLDARKAAKLLRERKGYRVVKVLCSISSPHRGSPIAQHVLEMGAGVQSIASALAEMFGNVVYGSGNDLEASLKQLVYDDYDAADGIVTGMKAFNITYPVSSSYAERYVSFLTAQEGISVNPALWIARELFYDIDGDGYCVDDGDGDGAGGCGDGYSGDTDDDGLVGINSQQMGYRLDYDDNYLLFFEEVWTDYDRGYVGDLNSPSSIQMTSHSNVINQDHLDVIGVGPDTFDEMDFYAALIDYIDYWD
ncbi:esterase/lipase family protein [Desulfosediminicola ganghwensis]|uniref:esterase/lipase family protein n=1 Tax=Desulfosediminicola ganghwensis TaxID=2569540 RepID=UPI0010ABA1AC|nr:acetyltransferase [Desulfosediminicola ganghwensis]